MALGPGTRLGPYIIDAPIGAGGMGEVYKARDSRLNRAVAVKILPEALAASSGFRERFEREARLVAALTHPNICVVHDVGREGSTAYLVMEYLDGQTLAERLRRGPVPVDEALQIAVQIAEALAHAHRHGIVHRDLKPANVMLTRAGAKLLDFGLAKPTQRIVPMAPGASVATAAEPLTARGSILGTVRYMAPEQLEGREGDARSDIFAFGVVFYELLTGVSPFKGDSHAAVIGAILRDTPPDPSTLRRLTAPDLDHVVTRCLAKDPDGRWQSAADLADAVRWSSERTAQASRAGARTAPWRAAAWLAAGAVIGATAILLWPKPGVRSGPAPFLIPIGSPADTDVQGIELSPDGRRIVYAAAAPGRPATLWVSSTTVVAPTLLDGTEGASQPFWSPDAQSIGFFADGRLKRIPAGGGQVTTICPAPFARGAAWTGHSIVFSAALAMQVVADAGGTPAPVPDVPPGSVRWPTMLPDQRHFVYYENKARSDLGALYLASLDGGKPVEIAHDAQRAIFVAPGALVFGRRSTLLAQRMDTNTWRPLGDAVPIANDLWFDLTALGLVNVSASADGAALLYRAGGEARTQLTWFTREGLASGTLGDAATDLNVQLSPDMNSLLVSRANPRDGHRAVWIGGLRDASWRRLSLGPTDDDLNPVWSPDGSEIAFTSTREARTALYRRPASGGEPRRITADSKARFPRAWSADGSRLIVDALRADGSVGTEVLTLADGASASLEPANIEAWFGQFSPDGKWIAYSANSSGRFEVYVQPFPATGDKWQISTGGGLEPRWRRDGRELYFISPDQHIVAAALEPAGKVLHAGSALPLFAIRITRADRPDTLNHYAVAPDGRFLVSVQPSQRGPVAGEIAGWSALLFSR